MIVVIFEVNPKQEYLQEYLDFAAILKLELEKIDGFISIERFSSLSNEGKILSLSFWRDEEAVKKWRTYEQHQHAQLEGRKKLFYDYRLKVANVIRDYGLFDRDEAPQE